MATDKNFVVKNGLTSTGDILLDSSNAEINIKSGVGGTTGAVNWTFNSDNINYVALKIPYDTRATTGFHIDSGYPITIDATTRINFAISGTTRYQIEGTSLKAGGQTVLDSGTRNLTNIGTISSGVITASGDISVVESGDSKIISNSVGDYFPSLEIKRTSGSSKTNYHWLWQLGSSGFLNLVDNTNSYYPVIFKNNGDVALANNTSAASPVLLLDQSAASATFSGTISSGAQTITSTGTIGTTTPANGYLQITDGTNTLALDPNEIYSNDDLVITTGGDFDIRNGSFSMANQIIITSSLNLINIGTITASSEIQGGSLDINGVADISGNVSIGSGTQTNNGDANLTIREGDAFAGFDFKSARTSGNIGGLRFYNTSSDSVPKSQLLVETDGSYNFYNGSSGAQNRLKIDSSGNVGIGATTIDEKLHLEGSVDGGIEVKVQNNSTGTSSYAAYQLRGQGNNFWIKNWGDSVSGKSNQTEFISTAGSSHFQFTPASTEMMVINNTGVGIGTTNPDADLHISSAGGTELHLQEETSGQAAQIKFTNVNNSFEIGADASPQIFFINTTGNQGSGLCIDTNNRVGINTTSPQTKLHIEGNNVGIPTTYGGVVYEAVDAQIDVISDSSGTWGSAINFVEGTSTTANSDIWSIARKTTGGSGDSSLNFNFGTGNAHDNTNRVAFSSGGNITLTGTVDGVDIAARDAVLTSTTTTANAALPKAGGTMSGHIYLANYNIYDINTLSFNDPGPNEGISWDGGNTRIYESPDDLTTNTAGNLQFVYGSTRRLTVNSTGIDVNSTITTTYVDAETLKANDSGSTPGSCKLHVGGILSAGSSAVAQLGGFVRMSDQLIIHSGTSADTVFVKYSGGNVDLTEGEGGGANPDLAANNVYLTGSVDRRVKLGDSGVSGASTSNNAVYVRGNDDHLILNCAGNGHISFTDNGSEIARLTDGTFDCSKIVADSAASEFFVAGSASSQTIVAVIGSTSNRPVLQFSESTSTAINAGMSIEYDGRGSGATNYMAINDVSGANVFKVYSGGDVHLKSGAKFLFNGTSSYGIGAGGQNYNSGYFDTVESGLTADPLELCYYQGRGVNIGQTSSLKNLGCGGIKIGGADNTIESGYMLHLESTGDAAILLEADTDNVTEGDNPKIRFRQDGGAVEAQIMLTANNDFLIDHVYTANNILFGFNGATKGTMTNGGNLTMTGNVTAYSDERLKTNIETLDPKKTLQMRGVSFEKEGVQGSGVIAQELEEVAPELVLTNDDEMKTKSVAYGNLVGYLIETIKEQQKDIDKLKEQVSSLTPKN